MHCLLFSGAESEQNTVRQFDRINNSWDMTDLIVTRDNTSNLPTSVFISMRFDFGKESITTSHLLVSCQLCDPYMLIIYFL